MVLQVHLGGSTIGVFSFRISSRFSRLFISDKMLYSLLGGSSGQEVLLPNSEDRSEEESPVLPRSAERALLASPEELRRLERAGEERREAVEWTRFSLELGREGVWDGEETGI